MKTTLDKELPGAPACNEPGASPFGCSAGVPACGFWRRPAARKDRSGRSANSQPGTAALRTRVKRGGALALCCDLFKVGLTSMVLLTTLAGFYMGSTGPMDCALLLRLLGGTALLASGAATLNEFLEREHDAKMRRTQNRPLPAARITPEAALILGGICAGAGLICLAALVCLPASLLGALTLLNYLFFYTPMKRLNPVNTIIGALSGALPVLIGWTAARGEGTGQGWALFAILFFWQLPHFLALAWIYRDDYRSAGFSMLAAHDPEGLLTSRFVVCHTACLLPVSVTPFLLRLAGPIYLYFAFGLGVLLLACAIGFARKRTVRRARAVFYASIAYLPLLLGLMALGKRKALGE